MQVTHFRSRSYTSYFLIWIGVIVLFALLYFSLSYVPGHGSDQIAAAGDPLFRFLTALYFSVITGATVGYGDVLPLGTSRALAAFEGILSFVLLAMFVSRVASRQQDAAIADIHSLARDSLFNNFRHGLFIARKDLDGILKKLDNNESLGDRDWKNIRTAFRQMHAHIDDIPQLYSTQGGSVDEDHEQLALDSVERSLRRAGEVIDTLERAGSSCRADQKCMGELERIVRVSHHSFRTLYPHAHNTENEEAFQEMLDRINELESKLA